MGEENENNIGYRYVSYGEKYDNYTKKNKDGNHVPVRTPMVGLKTRIKVRRGYVRTDKVDSDGKPLYTDPEMVLVPESAAVTQSMQAALDGNYHFESKSMLKVVDLISEGPIEGFCSRNGETLSYFSKNKDIPLADEEFLQSVYFDGTRVLNPEIGPSEIKSTTFNIDLDSK